MREVKPGVLYVGHAADARDLPILLAKEIRAIVDLALAEPAIAVPRELVYCRFPLIDGAGNDAAVLQIAVDATAALIRAGIPTLVACGAGMSRSVAVAAAALALVEGSPLADTLERIAHDGPHDVSPGLWKELAHIATLRR